MTASDLTVPASELEALAKKWDRLSTHPAIAVPAQVQAEQDAKALRALIAEAREEGKPRVSAWLIEDPGRPGKFWLPNIRTGVDWTDDANKAVRFLRHNDANEVISTRPNMDELWVAREHIWFSDAEVNASRTPPATAGTQGPGLREAFVQGAKWWEFESRGATMWQSDQQKAWDEAERKAKTGRLGVLDPLAARPVEAKAEAGEPFPHVEGKWIIARHIEGNGDWRLFRWSTSYSIHGLGGAWWDIYGGCYGDMHLGEWCEVPDGFERTFPARDAGLRDLMLTAVAVLSNYAAGEEDRGPAKKMADLLEDSLALRGEDSHE